MEKLIIKNFGPISDIEIELKKYVVLIGDTSTGKSVIAKLICIFQDCLFLGIENIEDFRKKIKEYNIPYLNESSQLEYYLGDCFIKIEKNLLESDKIIDNGVIKGIINIGENKILEFSEKIEGILNKESELKSKVDNDQKEELEGIFEELRYYSTIFNRVSPLYIPAERMFFSMVGESLAGLWANEINVSKSYLNFAKYYEVAKKNISNLNYQDLNFIYHRNDKKEYIKCGKEDVEVKYASSGIQAILPLLIVLNNLLNKKNKTLEENHLALKTICIEEPEISLFPERQKGLLEYIVSIIKKIKSRVVITTHSPYILSAFNNLILANNTADEKKDRTEEIEVIIERDKWVDFEEVSVYEVKDGKIISLLESEYKGIDINAIDKVSDRLSEDVDKLISIRYEE